MSLAITRCLFLNRVLNILLNKQTVASECLTAPEDHVIRIQCASGYYQWDTVPTKTFRPVLHRSYWIDTYICKNATIDYLKFTAFYTSGIGIDNGEVQENKAFLIDVDVVRGSVFAKTKPRHGWSWALLLGLLRSAFAPFYWDYWNSHTSRTWAAYIMFHYALQFIQAVCFLLTDPESTTCSQDDVLVPCLLAICLGVLHTHVTAVHGAFGSSSTTVTATTSTITSPTIISTFACGGGGGGGSGTCTEQMEEQDVGGGGCCLRDAFDSNRNPPSIGGLLQQVEDGPIETVHHPNLRDRRCFNRVEFGDVLHIPGTDTRLIEGLDASQDLCRYPPTTIRHHQRPSPPFSQSTVLNRAEAPSLSATLHTTTAMERRGSTQARPDDPPSSIRNHHRIVRLLPTKSRHEHYYPAPTHGHEADVEAEDDDEDIEATDSLAIARRGSGGGRSRTRSLVVGSPSAVIDLPIAPGRLTRDYAGRSRATTATSNSSSASSTDLSLTETLGGGHRTGTGTVNTVAPPPTTTTTNEGSIFTWPALLADSSLHTPIDTTSPPFETTAFTLPTVWEQASMTASSTFDVTHPSAPKTPMVNVLSSQINSLLPPLKRSWSIGPLPVERSLFGAVSVSLSDSNSAQAVSNFTRFPMSLSSGPQLAMSDVSWPGSVVIPRWSVTLPNWLQGPRPGSSVLIDASEAYLCMVPTGVGGVPMAFPKAPSGSGQSRSSGWRMPSPDPHVQSSTSSSPSGISNCSHKSRRDMVERSRTSTGRQLDTESVHNIGAGLGANSKCLPRSYPCESNGTKLGEQMTSDSCFPPSECEQIATTIHPNHEPLQSPVLLSDAHATALSKSWTGVTSNETHALHAAVETVDTDLLSLDDENELESFSSNLDPSLPHNNNESLSTEFKHEDTVTAHLRQRLKFLQLFVHRSELARRRQTLPINTTIAGVTASASVSTTWSHNGPTSRHISASRVHNNSRRYLSRSTNHLSTASEQVSALVHQPLIMQDGVDGFELGVESRREMSSKATRAGNSLGRRKPFVCDDQSHSNTLNLPPPKRLAHMRSSAYKKLVPKLLFCPTDKRRGSSSCTRGQTASETEYDRINSDVGSDFYTSSSPDDLEPFPRPSVAPSHPSITATEEPAHWRVEPETRLPNSGIGRLDAVPTRRKPNRRHTQSDSNSTKPRQKPIAVRPSSLDTMSDQSPTRDFIASSEHSRTTSTSPLPSRPLLPTVITTQQDVSLSNAEDIQPQVVHTQREQQQTLRAPESLDWLREEDQGSQFHSPQSLFLRASSPGLTEKQKYVFNSAIPEPYPKTWSSHSAAFTDTIRCYVWDRDKVAKFDLTMLDVGYNVIRAVERQCISADYVILAGLAAIMLPLLSVGFHWTHGTSTNTTTSISSALNQTSLPLLHKITTAITTTPTDKNNPTSLGSSVDLIQHHLPNALADSLLASHLSVLAHLAEHAIILVSQPLGWFSSTALGVMNEAMPKGILAWLSASAWDLISFTWMTRCLQAPDLQGRLVIILGIVLRFHIYGTVFFLLCIAERTFQQRLLYAKYFFSITSARRARKYRVPQFRLNKLRHIKYWLTLRSYLKKRGPQRSVETIIAAAFYIVFVLGLVLCSQLLTHKNDGVFYRLANWDILGLTLAIMFFLHRFIILGTKITKKYRNFSILITEQINLYLSVEKKPHKKEELMATFQVLRLVESLLKEVDGPFRVCGWTVNPLMYNIFKLVLLSCFSSLLSETLGFKLKLYKLKLNAANW